MKHLEALNLRMNALRRVLERKKWYHSIRLPDGRVTDGLLPLASLEERFAALPIPADLHGKRVLDIGAWDGWFSFEMERRGAEVVAVDFVDLATFRQAHQALNSQVKFRQMDVLELSPSSVGRFDIVLFQGVLYHLKHPLLALERVCSVTNDLAIIESFVTDSFHERYRAGIPLLEFYETTELGGQLDNWWGPNISALQALVRTAGFIRTSVVSSTEDRACLAAYRSWTPPAGDLSTAPALTSAFNPRNGGINCYSARDDYIDCWFTAEDTELGRNSVFGQVGQYGVQPVYVTKREQTWEAILSLPPGLSPGWQPVRVRTSRSAWSNTLEIAVDFEQPKTQPTIISICDADTWSVGRGRQGGYTALWISDLPPNADRSNLSIYIGEHAHRPDFVARRDRDGFRQVNVKLGPEIVAGEYPVRVRVESVCSDAITLVVTERSDGVPTE